MQFADVWKQMTDGRPVRPPSGTADIESAVTLIEDVLRRVAGGDAPDDYLPAIRATLVGLQKETAEQCAKMADEVDDLSGVGYGISRRFGLQR